MKKNLGDADRTLRLVLGASIGFIMSRLGVASTAGMVLGIIAVYLFATSGTGWCLLYAVTGRSTAGPTDASAKKP
jgi:hypothetical protein